MRSSVWLSPGSHPISEQNFDHWVQAVLAATTRPAEIPNVISSDIARMPRWSSLASLGGRVATVASVDR
jgi:hypothetical protein